MDPARGANETCSPEAIEFVRFCYRRRRAGWPELYDEMCAVASRGAYLGWSHNDLADHGIGFGLFDLPSLAAIVRQVAAEESERRRSLASASQEEATLSHRERKVEASEPIAALAMSAAPAGAG